MARKAFVMEVRGRKYACHIAMIHSQSIALGAYVRQSDQQKWPPSRAGALIAH
jgi:hypothetical protein